jgi:hypothetical protein
MQRGDDLLMHKLIEANYIYREYSQFPAGLYIVVPDMPEKTAIELVPWKVTSIV